MKKLLIFSLFAALAFANCISASAQSKAKVNVSGQVFSVSTTGGGGEKQTVPFAVVILPESSIAVSSDADGAFSIPNVTPGAHKIQIQSLGYQTLDTTMNVLASKENKFEYVLMESNFRMEEIVVTAEVSKAGAATSSIINKNALEHLQATSLGDIMSLLPGASQQKPDLQGVSTAFVRGGSSLGTAVIVDGAPMSNNANLQVLSQGSGSETGAVSPTTGIDLRTITTNNVESIEVIRGIAPVEYGDMTAGAVIVNAKAGFQPLTVKLNINPNVYSASATQGFKLGNKAGNINYNVDYAYSVDEPREGYDYYQRVTAKVGYTNTFGKFYTNNSLSFLWTYDRGYPNPADETDKNIFYEKDYGIRFTHNGQYNANADFFKSLQYNISFNYTNRHSFYENLINGNGDAPYSTSKVDGSVMSSILNGHVYDQEGNQITSYDPSQIDYAKAWILPSTYTSQYNIYGKELNTFAKVKANFAGDWGRTNHRLVVGADFKSDGNLGDGRVYDIECPPARLGVGSVVETLRERAFKDIPFLNQFGAYLQETFSVDIAKRKLELVAGLRYDHVFNFGGGLSPRLNLSYELVPNVLSLNAAYGITRKAPTLYYLYPDSKYYDAINFDNALSTNIPDDKKMQVITTYVMDRKTDELEMMRQEKYEIGLSANIGKMHFSIVGYQEVVNNGFGMYTDPDDLRLINYVQYKQVQKGFDPETGAPNLILGENGMPVLAEKANNAYFISVNNPGNRDRYRRTGIEYVFNFGRIDAIRTTFQLDGTVYTTKTLPTKTYSFSGRIPAGASGDFSRYSDKGVFDNLDISPVSYSEHAATNITAVHNIPQIGLVISATAHISWRSKNWDVYTTDRELLTIPKWWIPRTDAVIDGVEYKAGQMYDFKKEWANEDNPNYDRFQYLTTEDSYNWDTLYERENVFKPTLTIGLNVSKEFGKLFNISFFAQNMFRSSRLQELALEPGYYVRMGGGGFFFGLQLNATIK
ncbi:MAG: TonB-dependent receptor [Bacteroidales bacterium]|nr:TonB-dependent receptor [Bacteroidales bacterium]